MPTKITSADPNVRYIGSPNGIEIYACRDDDENGQFKIDVNYYDIAQKVGGDFAREVATRLLSELTLAAEKESYVQAGTVNAPRAPAPKEDGRTLYYASVTVSGGSFERLVNILSSAVKGHEKSGSNGDSPQSSRSRKKNILQGNLEKGMFPKPASPFIGN